MLDSRSFDLRSFDFRSFFTDGGDFIIVDKNLSSRLSKQYEVAMKKQSDLQSFLMKEASSLFKKPSFNSELNKEKSAMI